MSRIALALAVVSTLACAGRDGPSRLHNLTPIAIDEHSYSTTGESYELLEYTNDPVMGFNRGSFSLTRVFVDYALAPVARGWRFLLPHGVRESIDNFAYNLAYPDRLVGLLLQGEVVDSGVETGNFLLNTTVGLAGFFDVATPLGVPSRREDVGQAFGKWGFGPGFYLFLPLLGPSSGRDGLGRIFDTALSPATYVPGAGMLFNVNAFSSRIDTYDNLSESSTDLYVPVRFLWAVKRDIEVENYVIPEAAWASADPNPSLGVLLARLDDPAFPRRGSNREVEIATTGKQLPYTVWLQPKPAPLVFIVPGIGAHRTATNAVKLAEAAYARGWSAVTISSPFHAEFIETALSETYPGYTPSDAEDLYSAMNRIRADIESSSPGRVTESSLMGYSLGGIETLFISQLERKQTEPDALHFASVVAINPAVDLEYAANLFDGYFDATRSWPAAERRDHLIDVVKRGYVLLNGGGDAEIEKRQTLPFDRKESEFLIGLSSRAMTLRALDASRQRGGEPLSARSEIEKGEPELFSAMIRANTLRRYLDELAVPYFVAKDPAHRDAQALFAAANLRSQEAGLRDDARVHVLTNADDFILAPRDIDWLRGLLGGRLTVFPKGGHLGNMHVPAVQTAIVDRLGEPQVAQAR